MVKRLRRRPLTAKTGVRVPMEVPPSLPEIDTILVGSFFTPPSLKAPDTRAFPGNFAKWYASQGAFRHKEIGADGYGSRLRRFLFTPFWNFAGFCGYFAVLYTKLPKC